MARKSRKFAAISNEPEYSYKMLDTVGYTRLSVEDRKKRGDSLETQKTIIENYVSIHPDLRLTEVYTDNGATGRNFERDGFKRMIADVEKGKIGCIIVKDLSRLGRNAIDTGYYIEKYFPLNKVRFISINDNYDSGDTKNKSGNIIVPLKNMINEAYALDISRKIRSQALQSMKAGDYIGGRPPYGYMKAPDNCHRLIIDAETAPVVRQIFEWAYNKVELNVIVKRLNEAGIISPSHYKRDKGIITHENLIGNGFWQTRTVQRLLNAEIYTGDMVQGKTSNIDRVQFKVDEKDWIRVSNTHEPIITREVFEAVKSYRSQIAEQCKRREKNPYTENIFKGKIFCGCCGRSLHRQREYGGYIFHCISNDRIAKGFCKGALIKEDELRCITLVTLQKKAEVIIGRSLELGKSVTVSKTGSASAAGKISKLKQEIEADRRYLKSLYESLVKGIITEEEYPVMKAHYETKIETSLSDIRNIENERKERETRAERYKDMADSISDINDNGDLSALMVERLIKSITVNNDKSVEIQLLFEDEFERGAVKQA